MLLHSFKWKSVTALKIKIQVLNTEKYTSKPFVIYFILTAVSDDINGSI